MTEPKEKPYVSVIKSEIQVIVNSAVDSQTVHFDNPSS